MHLLVLLGLFTDQIEIIAYPFIYLKPQEGTPFGRSLPPPRIGYYREYPPPPPTGELQRIFGSGKGVNVFLISTIDKVNSARGVLLFRRTTFL